jgi:hypothetical protein
VTLDSSRLKRVLPKVIAHSQVCETNPTQVKFRAIGCFSRASPHLRTYRLDALHAVTIHQKLEGAVSWSLRKRKSLTILKQFRPTGLMLELSAWEKYRVVVLREHDDPAKHRRSRHMYAHGGLVMHALHRKLSLSSTSAPGLLRFFSRQRHRLTHFFTTPTPACFRASLSARPAVRPLSCAPLRKARDRRSVRTDVIRSAASDAVVVHLGSHASCAGGRRVISAWLRRWGVDCIDGDA